MLCSVATAFGGGEDVLSQVDQLAECLRNGAAGEIVSGALGRATPTALTHRIARLLSLPADADAHLLGPDGRHWLSTAGASGRGPASRERLWAAAALAPLGVSSDIAVTDDWADLVRRDIGWRGLQAFDLDAILVLEHRRMLDRDADSPWSGKWIGAYTYQGTAVTGHGVTDRRHASSLSAMLLQSGATCWVRLAAAGWTFESDGIVHAHTLVAGAAEPVRILDLTYDPADDRLRGTLASASPDERGSCKIFLQRVQ